MGGALLLSGPVGNVDAKCQRAVPGPSLYTGATGQSRPEATSPTCRGAVGARMSQGVPAGGSRAVGAAPCLQALGSSPTTLGRGCRLHTQHPAPPLHQLALGINEFYLGKLFCPLPRGPQAAECEYCQRLFSCHSGRTHLPRTFRNRAQAETRTRSFPSLG